MTRRCALAVLAAGVLPARTRPARKSEFWDRKPPADWSEQEIERLLTRSPWAKPLAAVHGVTEWPCIVRWESAKPVLEALGTPLPGDFAGLYAICVAGIPGQRSPGDLERLTAATTLEVKSRPAATPVMLQEMVTVSGLTRSTLFGFSRDLPLSAADGFAVFRTRFDSIVVDVRFELPDMIYRGEFAV